MIGGLVHFTGLTKIPEKQMSLWGCDCSTTCNLKSCELYNLNWNSGSLLFILTLYTACNKTLLDCTAHRKHTFQQSLQHTPVSH